MDERRGSRPLVGREKKNTSERDAPPTEWNGGDGFPGRGVSSSPTLGTVMAITTNVRESITNAAK